MAGTVPQCRNGPPSQSTALAPGYGNAAHVCARQQSRRHAKHWKHAAENGAPSDCTLRQAPQLETTIGDHVYKLRSEAHLWPLYFLHILAEVGGLLAIAPARRWRLTPEGERFLGTAPLFQVPVLLTVWWYEVNWLVAYPFEGMGDALPSFFNLVTLARLRSLPIRTTISFEEFADGLIEKTGLTWTAPDSSAAATLLRSSITRMVIHILANLGAVKREYREEPLGKGTTSRLVAFEITPFGRALLDAVAIASS